MTEIDADARKNASPAPQSMPRRIAQLTADWTRTLIIIIGCLIALVCAVAVLYVAYQGMLYLIDLVRQALSLGRFS